MNIYIRHFAAACALGENLDEAADALMRAEATPGTLDFDELRDPLRLPYFTRRGDQPEDDCYRQLECMAGGLLHRAGLDDAQRARTALLMGSSSFDVHVSTARYRRRLGEQQKGVEAVPMPIIGYGKIAARIARTQRLSPHCYSYSTACTSSANAMLYAQRLLRAGLADHALVLGSEYCNEISALGFHAMGLISPGRRMRPFDPGRDGLLLGEGIGALLLSSDRATPAGERRWTLRGGAIGTDNHSLTAADDKGLGAVIEAALADSGVEPAAISAIKVHGTASHKNDEAEAAALARIFSGGVPPAFALKPYCGHTLGASGALETALTLACLSRGQLPANPGARRDSQLGIGLEPAPRPAGPGYYLFNCFAFGGNNNALVIHDNFGAAEDIGAGG